VPLRRCRVRCGDSLAMSRNRQVPRGSLASYAVIVTVELAGVARFAAHNRLLSVALADDAVIGVAGGFGCEMAPPAGCGRGLGRLGDGVLGVVAPTRARPRSTPTRPHRTLGVQRHPHREVRHRPGRQRPPPLLRPTTLSDHRVHHLRGENLRQQTHRHQIRQPPVRRLPPGAIRRATYSRLAMRVCVWLNRDEHHRHRRRLVTPPRPRNPSRH
jgi:hypothetical protein